MTAAIALVYGLLFGVILALAHGRLRVDLVALCVLAILGLTRTLSPAEAVSGFSSPAVITIWAMFILSEGLARAGVADVIGRGLVRVSGRGETRVVVVLMLVAGALSGVMNNVGVAALMLPVTIGLARRLGITPSRLLMPLAFAILLGGLTTLIGTAPNLLVSEALVQSGARPFELLDFAPIGVALLAVGTTFVGVFGRRLLPKTQRFDPAQAGRGLRAQYSLQERIFALRVPSGSMLAGRRLGRAGFAAASLLVIAITRGKRRIALPPRGTELHSGDLLLVQGRLDRFTALRKWSDLVIVREAPVLQNLLAERSHLRVLRVAPTGALAGQVLRHEEFRERFGSQRLAVRREGVVRRTRLAEMVLQPGDELLVQGSPTSLTTLEKSPDFDDVRQVEFEEVAEQWSLGEQLFVVRVPADAGLVGMTMAESRLGEVFDLRLVAIFRGGELLAVPEPEEKIQGDDLLLIEGRVEDLDVLRGLQQLEIERDATRTLSVFERGDLEMVEATLHPRSSLAGKRIGELEMRDRRGVEVAALWRSGQPHRTALEEMRLREGDALLFVGPRRKLAQLSQDPDLIVLNPISVQQVDARKMPVAAGLMLAVIGTALAGLAPIEIAAIAGAALMVFTRCLSMDDAYRAIDWRVIFLIAGLLPLGLAMQRTGASEHIHRPAIFFVIIYMM